MISINEYANLHLLHIETYTVDILLIIQAAIYL